MRSCLEEIESESVSECEFAAEFRTEFETPIPTRRPELTASTCVDSVVGDTEIKLAPMPSVGMRRSTRVFVPKSKDEEAVKVLRSGRRLCAESSVEENLKGGKDGEWLRLMDTSSGRVVVRQTQNGWLDDDELTEADGEDDYRDSELAPELVNEISSESQNGCVDKMYGTVYFRKRKRNNVTNSGVSAFRFGEEDKRNRMYGLHYVRNRKRRKSCGEGLAIVQPYIGDHGMLSISVESSSARSCRFADLLCSVVRRMTIAEVELVGLSAFLMSEPVNAVFASCGINFFLNGLYTKTTGLCKIFGSRQSIPLFSVHFSALPFTFLHLHASGTLRSMCRFSALLYPRALDSEEESSSSSFDFDELVLDPSVTTHWNDCVGDVGVDRDIGGARVACRNLQFRTNARVNQKRRRRSLRTRRARNPSLLGLNKANGSLPRDRVGLKTKARTFPPVRDCELRRSARKSSSNEVKLTKTDSICWNDESWDSVCCTTNILVTESDKCYREEGAIVMLETGASNECGLAVKKDGHAKYFYKAHRSSITSSTNRFTHAQIWGVENGWKLEFLNRNDWSTFKDLFAVCCERNASLLLSIGKAIPVPGVHEVDRPQEISSVSFVRPDSYIKVYGDELSRALSRRSANYDVDSEDEEWLKKVNCEFVADFVDPLSVDSIELMIDAFEKALYCSPEDYTDEKAAVDLCLELGRKEVVEAVHSYWMKKRKQKRGPLLRVFQLHQPRRSQVIAKPFLRKKRSFKRQATMSSAHSGRGKERCVLQALAAEENLKEEQVVMFKVQEARATAKRSTDLAIIKRQRAQFLMGNADLAMYRAAMALSIAEAAKVVETDRAAAHIFD